MRYYWVRDAFWVAAAPMAMSWWQCKTFCNISRPCIKIPRQKPPWIFNFEDLGDENREKLFKRQPRGWKMFHKILIYVAYAQNRPFIFLCMRDTSAAIHWSKFKCKIRRLSTSCKVLVLFIVLWCKCLVKCDVSDTCGIFEKTF